MPSAMPPPSPTPATTAPAPRSPSPPVPPTARAPGPRASALQKVFNDALSHTLRACSYNNFAECFPTPAKYVPQALDGLHRDFVGKLEEMCKGEIEALMDERDVITSLNELDDLIADARRRRERATGVESEDGGASAVTVPIPPHLLAPTSLLAAHLAPFLTSQSASFTTALQATQADNAAIADAITSQRAEIEGLLRGLENTVADLENAANTLGGSEEMVGIEKELESAAAVLVG